ncbi:MAG: hypothetical protein OEY41_05055 [Acidimicrobiia bacterium]|nr:hypothetical protein [Acidimicrobiia bacterium]
MAPATTFETVTGYCWPQSVAAGESVALHLSSPRGLPVTVEVARIGAGRTVVFGEPAVPADHHATPPNAAAHGCHWPAPLTLDVDPAWQSGYYEVTLEVDLDGKRRRNHAFFVVRPASTSSAPILLALSTNTWHAYNDFGGPSLYTGNTQVSLQRPMSPGFLHKPPGHGRRVTVVGPPDPQMAGHVGYLQLNHLSAWAGSAGWPDWEQPFLAWAEANGYAVDVVTNADLEDHPDLLASGRYALYLSVGHDEYWSGPMRDTVENFIAHGGNAAFLSGNTAFWQVRLEDRPEGGGPATTMIGYKDRLAQDPVFGTDRQHELTTIWSDHLLGRPENRMTGVSFTRGGYHRIGKRVTAGAGGYTVHRTDTGCSTAPVSPTATCSAPPPPLWATSATAAPSPTATASPTPPARTALRPRSRSWPPPPLPTSPGPQPPGRPNPTSHPRSSSSPAASSVPIIPPPSSASPTATPCSAPTPHPAAAPWSRPARPTGLTAWTAVTPRSSRSPTTSCAVSAPRPDGRTAAPRRRARPQHAT